MAEITSWGILGPGSPHCTMGLRLKNYLHVIACVLVFLSGGWWVEQQHCPHLGLVINAESQACTSPQTQDLILIRLLWDSCLRSQAVLIYTWTYLVFCIFSVFQTQVG